MEAVKIIIFDCDSTLSAIEGIDELARVRGPEVFRKVEAMTETAMDGKIPLESIFARRLEIIQPTLADVKAVSARYVETVEPTALATVQALKERGWSPIIVSGGFRQVIQPLADFLGIARVEAVDLFFNPDGSYRGYDANYPTTRSGGKPEILTRLRQELRPVRVIAVGDGMSDLELKPMVDLFAGFGGYLSRSVVKAESGLFIFTLAELLKHG